jgi:autophagy-related protein 18
MLATTSTKGTVIRVFDTPEGNLLYSFRRGSYPASIYSLCFNKDSTLVAASSSSGTVHAFKMDEASKRGSEEHIGSLTGLVSGYMPGMVTDMMDPRSFAQVKLKSAGPIATLCAINGESNQIHVVTSDGFFYTYELPREGGECRLLKEASLK